MKLRSSIDIAWGILKNNWRIFLGVHLAANLFYFAVLGPLFSLVTGWMVQASGDVALTDQDILFFFLSPLGFVLGVAAIGILITVAVFETAAMLVAIYRIQAGQSVGLVPLGRFVISRLVPLFELAIRMVLRAFLIALPYLLLALVPVFLFLTDHDINYYLSNKPPVFWWTALAVGILLIAMTWHLFRLFSGWVIALPLLLLEKGTPGEVLKTSRVHAVPLLRPLIVLLLVWAVSASLVYGLAGGFLDLGSSLVVALAGDSLKTLAYLMAGLVVLWSIAGFFAGLFATTTLVLGIYLIFEAVMPAQTPRVPKGYDSKARPGLAGPWISAALLSAIVLAGVAFAWQVMHRPAPRESDIIAHRGASWDAPENTLAAISLAIDKGADWVEIDVQETSGGEVLVIHDSDFMKVAGNPLRVRDATPELLRDIDIGSWKDPRFNAERVATLAELLALAKGRIKVNIELKYYGQEKRLEERVAEIVEAAEMENDVVIMSLSLPGIRTMKALRPGWETGLLSSVAVGDISALDADFFAVNARFVTRGFVQRAQGRQRQVLTWTVNDVALMTAMMGKGVDGVITDRPELAYKVREQLKEMEPHELFLVELASFLGSEFDLSQ